jgi:hypothetical protein
MTQTFGNEAPRAHSPEPRREPARYLVIIGAGGTTVTRLFLASRVAVAEFDAGTEETAQMVQGLTPGHDGDDPAWDAALEGHSAAERSAAEVYTLDV